MLLARILLGERVQRTQDAGVVLALTGVVLIAAGVHPLLDHGAQLAHLLEAEPGRVREGDVEVLLVPQALVIRRASPAALRTASGTSR